MTSKLSGQNFKKNIKSRPWWLKIFITLIFSNVLFFMIFSEAPQKSEAFKIPQGWVEIQITAEMRTPFGPGKRILLINRTHKKQIEGRLGDKEESEKLTVLVKESEASTLFQVESWEVLPYMSSLTFKDANSKRGENHEIRY